MPTIGEARPSWNRAIFVLYDCYKQARSLTLAANGLFRGREFLKTKIIHRRGGKPRSVVLSPEDGVQPGEATE